MLPTARVADRARPGGLGRRVLLALAATAMTGAFGACASTDAGSGSGSESASESSSPAATAAGPSAVSEAVRDAVTACQDDPRSRGDLTRGTGLVPRSAPSGAPRSPDGASPLESVEGLLDGDALGGRGDGTPVLVEETGDTAVVAVLRDQGPDVDGVLSLERRGRDWQVQQLLTCR